MAKLDIDEDLVRKLAALLKDTGLSEIEFESDDNRIRVARNMTTAIQAGPAAGAEVSAAPPLPAAGDKVSANAVTSPMVGTAYVASEPSAPPFVKVGDNVSEGQTLLIIEAMKVMNPVLSPRAGKVTAILVADGEPIEFGEPLMIIE